MDFKQKISEIVSIINTQLSTKADKKHNHNVSDIEGLGDTGVSPPDLSNYYTKQQSDKKYVGYKEERVHDANTFKSNGYAKTDGEYCVNLPSECSTTTDRWGVLQFIAENEEMGTGVQYFYPIDGTQKSRIFTRAFLRGEAQEWHKLAFTSEISSTSNKLVSVYARDGVLTLKTDKYQTTAMRDHTNIVLPSVDSLCEIHLFFDTSSALTLTMPSCRWQNGSVPKIESNKSYELIFTYVQGKWLGGCVVYE